MNEDRWTIDRFESDLAVVELGDGRFLDLPRWMLPAEAAEGMQLVVQSHTDEGGARILNIAVDHAATEAAREEVQAMVERLRSRDPGGDIEL